MAVASPSSPEVAFRIVITHYNQLLRVLNLVPWTPPAVAGDGRRASVSAASDGGDAGAGDHSNTEDDDADDDEPSLVPPESLWPKETLCLSSSGGVGLFSVFTSLDDGVWYRSSAEVGEDGPARVPARLVVTEIPPPIKLVMPDLTVQEYRRLKRDPSFLVKTMRSCEGCFLVYAQVCASCCCLRRAACFRVCALRGRSRETCSLPFAWARWLWCDVGVRALLVCVVPQIASSLMAGNSLQFAVDEVMGKRARKAKHKQQYPFDNVEVCIPPSLLQRLLLCVSLSLSLSLSLSRSLSIVSLGVGVGVGVCVATR
jgi:hypothetical protein